jgi:hypothetical protein
MEAGEFPGVAGGTLLFDLKQDRISIAIDRDRNDFLEVARRFTLFPELIT